ncbi:MAG: hypothetical protein ABR613_03125 [Actinomycetota bacterium]
MDAPDNEQQSERPRPKVVDKRISARSAERPAAGSGATAEVTVGSVPEGPSGGGGGPEPSQGQAAPQPQGSQAAREPQPGEPSAAPPPGERVWTPEQEAEARRIAQEIAQTPSLEWVVNTAATLANVAGTKLDLGAAADAQLAIDALAGIVSSVGPRLAGAEQPLRQLLADLQLAYAERVAAPPGPSPSPRP